MGPLDLLGGAIGGITSALGAKAQRDFEAGQAQKQMDFQERMSSTSWQRGVSDMKAAGINPIQAFSAGGASSPGGAMADAPNIGEAGVSGFSSGMQAANAVKQGHVLDEQRKLTKNQADKAFWDAQQSGFESSFPDSIVSGDGPDARRIKDTFWGMNRSALIDNASAHAADARANAAMTREKMPNVRLENLPGRLWALGRGAARPGDKSSAFQRFQDQSRGYNPLTNQ